MNAQTAPVRAPCPTPTKRRYGDEPSARHALESFIEKAADRRRRRAPRRPVPVAVYRCRCGFWHLTSRDTGPPR